MDHTKPIREYKELINGQLVTVRVFKAPWGEYTITAAKYQRSRGHEAGGRFIAKERS